MRSFKILLAAFIAAASAFPAFGAIIINAGDVGYNFTIDYAGLTNSSPDPLLSAQGSFTFAGVSNDGKTFNFNYSLTNDSQQNARLSGFAFDTSPDPVSASVTGAFDTPLIEGNYPAGIQTVDFCFTDDGSSSCAGGAQGGFTQGNTGTGTFAITFANVMNSVTFDEFYTRFQSVGPNMSESGVGVGSVVQSGGGDPITAPEPTTWLMLLGGFGMVGAAMRRRPTAARPSRAG